MPESVMVEFYDRLCFAVTNYEGNGSDGLMGDASALYEEVVGVVIAMSEWMN